jgi:putative endonuclease
VNSRKAEVAASLYLEMRGYEVMERGWRRARSEIDIIAKKDNVVHFVSVNYKNLEPGSTEIETLQPAELRKMQHSAWAWVDETKWQGKYVISTIEIVGPDFVIFGFNENVL